MRPGEPRPEFNMDFYCHGKVIVILIYTKLQFINPFKAGGCTGGFVLFASVKFI